MTAPGANASRSARFIAVLMPEMQRFLDDRLYYGPMLQGLNDGLIEHGLFMRPVQCLHEYQREHFLSSSAKLYGGVVFLGAIYTYDLFVTAVTKYLPGPKVMLDHHVEGLNIHSVREDAVAGMRLVVEYLAKLGHRRIAYLDNHRPDLNPWKRQGIEEGLRAAGLLPLARGWVAGCSANFADVFTAFDWFMNLEPRPTAVICADDLRATLLLQAAAERGLCVPRDLSIVGFGDNAVRSGRSRNLTSAGLDPHILGRRAAELVAGPESAAPIAALIPPMLAVRGTTAPPPANA